MIHQEVENVMNNKYSNVEAIKLKLLTILYLTKDLLNEHRLTSEVVLRNHHHACGTCTANGERITLQIDYVITNDIEEIKNTILHEIAHALVGGENGHNAIWQEKAKELGVKFFKNYRK